jgi:hypothetical protein
LKRSHLPCTGLTQFGERSPEIRGACAARPLFPVFFHELRKSYCIAYLHVRYFNAKDQPTERSGDPAFAESQLARLTSMMQEIASQEEQVARLMQLPGFGMVTAVTVWELG